jgi:hypothetical protein
VTTGSCGAGGSRPVWRAPLVMAAALAAASGSALAADPPVARDDGIAKLWREVWQAIELAVSERGRRPPVPVAVTWRDRRIASIDLGAPLLALAAVDLDRDRRAELAALTTRELVVLAPAGKGMRELGRIVLPGDPAVVRPRDPVGTLVADERGPQVELLVRSSELADGVALTWQGGALREVRRLAGFPLCPGGQGDLVPGRNTFDGATVRWDEKAPVRFDAPASFFSALCRPELSDPAGRSLAVAAVVDSERVAHMSCRSLEGECPAGPAQGGDYTGVGVALEVADIDNDGSPEVLTSRGGAPGDRDRVSVYSRQGERVSRVYSKEFHAGVVGLVAGDVDGDGDRDVVVAVRFFGSRHVSFWTLN